MRSSKTLSSACHPVILFLQAYGSVFSSLGRGCTESADRKIDDCPSSCHTLSSLGLWQEERVERQQKRCHFKTRRMSGLEKGKGQSKWEYCWDSIPLSYIRSKLCFKIGKCNCLRILEIKNLVKKKILGFSSVILLTVHKSSFHAWQNIIPLLIEWFLFRNSNHLYYIQLLFC